MDMKTIRIVAGILLVLPIVKQLIVLGLARLLGRAIGQAALNQQPDTIHLSPASPKAWKNAQTATSFASPLSDRGFQDAGTYTIPEMAGVVVRLMAKPEEHFYAAIYEHPQVGHWMDLATLYQDGTSSTFTTAKPTGLAPRPGHPSIHAPGAGHSRYARARRACETSMMPTTPANGPTERAYAESIAWRKQHGISACEVAEVAKAAEDAELPRRRWRIRQRCAMRPGLLGRAAPAPAREPRSSIRRVSARRRPELVQ
jgi:hypothetical protein